MKKTTYLLSFLFLSLSAFSESNCEHFPEKWWTKNLDTPLKSWEIAPSSVSCEEGKVILSKRNELGLLSNFAATAFKLDGAHYASLEGFWQMMKFPENKNDPRYIEAQKTGYTRDKIAMLTAFEAKKAGDAGSKIMKSLGINWVTYRNKKMIYKTDQKLAHYKLIKRAMRAKLNQNPKVKEVLLATKNLMLLPDHHQKENTPPAWEYFKIWMDLRSELK